MGIAKHQIAMGLGAAVLLSVAAASVALADMLPADQREYRNIDYGFSVAIPSKQAACGPNPLGSNHGVWFPLVPVADCDRADEATPSIDFSANYNAADEAETLAGLAKIECAYSHPRHIEFLRDVRLAGRPAAGCRIERADGLIEVRMITWRKTNPEPLAWIEIATTLLTTSQRYDGDLRRFHAMVLTLKIDPDTWPRHQRGN